MASPWRTLEHDAAPPARAAAIGYHGARAALAIALALLSYALFPAAPAVESPLLEVGSVAADNVIAPFAFKVPKSGAELAKERDDVSRAVSPIFAYAPAALDSSRAQLRALIQGVGTAAAQPGPEPARVAAAQHAATRAGVQLTPQEAQYLLAPRKRQAVDAAVGRVFDRWLSAGVAASGAVDSLHGEVLLRRGPEQSTVVVDSLLTFGSLMSRARLVHPDPTSSVGDAVYIKILSALFRPTVVYDRASTERRREELRGTVDGFKTQVRAGEKIVGAHEVVGREEHDKMRALRDELQGRNAAERSVGRVVGAVLFNALVIALFGITLLLFRPQLYGSFRALALFAMVFAVVLAASAAVSRVDPPRPELIPVALAAIVFSVLFDARISMIAVMVLSVLVGGQSLLRGTNALFLSLIAGVAAAFSARVIRRRNQGLYPIVTVAAAYLLAAVAIGLTLDWSFREIARSAGWGALNAVISIPLAMQLLLPLAEEFTGIDTYPKLLEWSDLNRPLLQRLSLEAPGTYNHTVVMANLAEAACNAIGANGLLARVGAYYHDIGKLKKPQYFVENQLGRNPHDKLKPTTSAAIIRNHVSEGVELAEEYGVPKAVRAFITEHHGTGQISYFLEKARERGDGAPANAAEFAYPGPLPQTAETAVCMLADGVEAAARVLSDPTPQKIREVVDHIVRQRMDQGQLREAPITLRQLEIVKEQFARMLIGQHHNRIDYPAASGGVTSEFASV